MFMKKIVVADDQAFNREYISLVVGSQYDVLQARSGQETLDLISTNPDISLE